MEVMIRIMKEAFKTARYEQIFLTQGNQNWRTVKAPASFSREV